MTRIAFFAPLSPMRGGVVDYSEELLPYLARYCRIDIYTHDGLKPDNPALVEQFQIFGHGEFLARDRQTPYDQVIYQLGCHSDHVPDYENLLKRPGLALFHELNLAGIIGAQTFGRARPRDYFKAVWANEGARAAAAVIWRFARTRQFPDYLTFDFNRLALTHSQGALVHNQYMRQTMLQRLKGWHVKRPVYQVPMGVKPLAEAELTDIDCLRQKFNLSPETFVIGSFGIVHESKGIEVALQAFKRLLEDVPDAIYLLVGQIEAPSVVETIQKFNLGDRVRLTGYVSMADFYQYIAATNLCINLRLPRTGGTSGALLRLMSVGRPVIISNQAQFAEMSDDICLKAEVGERAEESILGHMQAIAAQPDKARQMGENARRYINQVHSLEQSAQAYWAAIQGSLK